MTIEQAFDRLVAANPVPDVDRYIAEAFDLDASLTEYGTAIGSPERRPVMAVRHGPARVWVAAAAFVMVIIAAVAVLVASLGSGQDAVSDDPVEIVNTFFDRWNDGDVDAAMRLVATDAVVNGGLQRARDLRALMEFATEFNAAMEVSCVASDVVVLVSCSWGWTAPSVLAMGIEPAANRSIRVADGAITALVTPGYGAHEAAISAFAVEKDPDGFAAECDPEGAVVLSVYGFPFDARCGAFLAALEEDFIADLGN